MIPKIFHQCKAAPLKNFTWEERRLARKAQALMPEWKYQAWTDKDNSALVDKIFPNYISEYVKCPSGTSKTDIASYLYMYQYGGVYFYTDFCFLLPLNKDLLSHLCILGVEDEDMPELGGGPKLGNAFIASQPGLPLWTELVDSIFRHFRRGEIYPYSWRLSGPYALNCVSQESQPVREGCTILPAQRSVSQTDKI